VAVPAPPAAPLDGVAVGAAPPHAASTAVAAIAMLAFRIARLVKPSCCSVILCRS